MKFKKKEDRRVDASVLLRRRNKSIHRREYFGAETEGKAIQSLPYLGIQPIYIQPPKLDNIVEEKRCMLTG